MKPWMQKSLIALGIGVVLFVGIGLLGNYVPNLQRYLYEKREARINAESERVQKEIEAAYQADTTGGNTPEETLDLFIKELELNNVEGAVAYYELSVQAKAREGLQTEFLNNKDLKVSADFFTEVRHKGIKTCVDVESPIGGCTFRYTHVTTEDKTERIIGTNDTIFVPKGSKETKVVDLGLNHYTKVWKIEQPY